MGARATSHADPGLLAWLGSHHVEYEVHEHARRSPPMASQRRKEVDPHTFAKVVAVRMPNGNAAFLVVETTDRL